MSKTTTTVTCAWCDERTDRSDTTVVDLCEQCFDMSETARLHPWVPIEDTFVEVEA